MTAMKPLTETNPNGLDSANLPMIRPTGFREYDVRWRYPDEINLPGIQALGWVMATAPICIVLAFIPAEYYTRRRAGKPTDILSMLSPTGKFGPAAGKALSSPMKSANWETNL